MPELHDADQMCHSEHSTFECGHGTVIEIACLQATQSKAACSELPTDKMDNETRIESLCDLCSSDQRLQRVGDAFVGIGELETLPTDQNCGNDAQATTCEVQ